MQVFHDPKALAATLRGWLDSSGKGIVAIEGHSGSGKTKLGEALTANTESRLISTDDYVVPDKRALSYFSLLDLDRLRNHYLQARSRTPVLVIEGICLRDTLEALSITPDVVVYCKRITQAGLWADDPSFHDDVSDKGQEVPGWVDRQSIKYHSRFDPFGKADFVYHRVE